MMEWTEEHNKRTINTLLDYYADLHPLRLDYHQVLDNFDKYQLMIRFEEEWVHIRIKYQNGRISEMPRL